MNEQPGVVLLSYVESAETVDQFRDRGKKADSKLIDFTHNLCAVLFSFFFFGRLCFDFSKLISRNGINSRCNDFHGAMVLDTRLALARTETRRERAEPYAKLFTSKACRSMRVAASWPTITELTPTVMLRRLFTCTMSRERCLSVVSCNERSVNWLVPPLRGFSSTSRTRSYNRIRE